MFSSWRINGQRLGWRGVPALAMVALAASAAEPAPEPPVESIVVTGTRLERATLPLPMAASVVDGETLRDRGQWPVSLAEALAGVPGVNVQNRQNYAQDVQLSSRGFGARSSFGVRGIRLYVDGIPATFPDGQGQVSHFPLASAARIEILRGPFSLLHGNAAGGVIQLFSEEGGAETVAGGSLAIGSADGERHGARVGGTVGDIRYFAETSRFSSDGFRPQSAVRRDAASAKLNWESAVGTRLVLVGNWLDQPLAQDPLGLTAAELANNPRGTTPVAIQFDTRKSLRQAQGGLVVEQDFSGGRQARLAVYEGNRVVRQFQSIPVAAQRPATHPGGVIDLDGEQRGVDGRFTWRLGEVTAMVGGSVDVAVQHRRGYQNFVGPTLGVLGELRRDERNRSSSADAFALAEWLPVDAFSITGGLRSSTVRFRTDDRYVTPGNPDDSGSVRFRETMPVFGATLRLNRWLSLYGAVGRGFETPTFNELGYRPDGATGLNLSLRPSRGVTKEVGAKWLESGFRAQFALFRVDTDDELATASNSGGRAVFQNVGATRRRGVEAELSWRMARDLELGLAATVIDARYRDGFFTCAATPCTTPTVAVPAGNRLPAVPGSAYQASLRWQPAPSWHAGLEARRQARIYANDVNDAMARPYTLVDLNVGREWRWSKWRFTAVARANNLLDRRHVASVIVNESAGRYFEPGPGRQWIVSVGGEYRFPP